MSYPKLEMKKCEDGCISPYSHILCVVPSPRSYETVDPAQSPANTQMLPIEYNGHTYQFDKGKLYCDGTLVYPAPKIPLDTERVVTDTQIGMLRQWLNEDRITDPNKMVTNEQIITWFEITTSLPKEPSQPIEMCDCGLELPHKPLTGCKPTPEWEKEWEVLKSSRAIMDDDNWVIFASDCIQSFISTHFIPKRELLSKLDELEITPETTTGQQNFNSALRFFKQLLK